MLKEYQHLINEGLNSVDENTLNKVRDCLLLCANRSYPILVIGNGGSAAIGDHWSCDHTKGIREDTNKASNVRNLASNMGLITAIANDMSYEDIFSKQIEWCQEENAYIIAISSSGSSPNIVNGLKRARQDGYGTIAFVGFDGGTIVRQDLADHIVHVKVNNYGVVEDCHQMLMHMLAQDIRLTYTFKDLSSLKL